MKPLSTDVSLILLLFPSILFPFVQQFIFNVSERYTLALFGSLITSFLVFFHFYFETMAIMPESSRANCRADPLSHNTWDSIYRSTAQTQSTVVVSTLHNWFTLAQGCKLFFFRFNCSPSSLCTTTFSTLLLSIIQRRLDTSDFFFFAFLLLSFTGCA